MKRFLPKSRLGRNIILLASGTAAGQIIVIAAIPLLTRLYTPEDFGLLATYAAILGIFSVIASLRYELAIPLPESNEEAVNILVLSILVVIVISSMSGAAVFFLASDIGALLSLPEISHYLWLIPIGVFLAGLYNISNYWAIRTKTFKAIAKTKFTQALVMTGVQLGAFKLGAPALLFGHIFGQSAGVSSLGLLAIKNHWPYIKKVTLNDIKKEAIKHYRFPLYSTGAGLLNSAGAQLPNILLATLFSPSAAGLFFLANRIMSVPMSLLGQAIGQTFFAEASEANRNNSLYFFARKTIRRLSLIIITPILIIIFFGESLVLSILGNDWRETGVIAQWLSLSIAVQFITSPIGQILAIKEKQHIGLILQGLLMFLRISGIYIGYKYNNFMLAISLYAIFGAIGYLFFLTFSLKYSRPI